MRDPERELAFVRDAGDAFLGAYLPIVARRRAVAWGERERQFQLLRRGRYVEFNLLYDRGTSFGLKTDGRTESILMSLPPLARWQYDAQFPAGSDEPRSPSGSRRAIGSAKSDRDRQRPRSVRAVTQREL